MPMPPQKFFLYARKSTDVEDKQVLSIEAQLSELRAFAKNEGLHIAAEFVEKQTAKVPGRPIFGEMMRRIERGEASGIVSWHPDRLARNSVDGGQVVYFLDIGALATLKFPTFWFENTPQGKFTLSMAFVQSKYYVDSLSENTKRGLRQKVRMGIFPSQAPVGYLNDSRTKTIIVDKKRSAIVRLAFEKYVRGDMRLEDVSLFLAKSGVTTRTGKRISKTKASFILANPFYIGLFKYGGELHEGKHEPIISKKLFDEAQEVLRRRGQPERKPKNEPQPFCGLMSCASCGMMITAEAKTKRQKNGNVHHYTYYRCTKKSKAVKCAEMSLRSEEMDKQVSSLIQKVSLPKEWAEELNRLATQDHKNSAHSLTACVKERKERIAAISQKLERLLNGYLDQVIDQNEYRPQKAKLLGEKKTLEGEIASFTRKQNDWLAPFQDWLKDAVGLDKIASDCDLFAKKVAAKEIFGSHLLLQNKKVRASAPTFLNSPQKSMQTAWATLRAAHSAVGFQPTSSILVPEVGVEPT
ncbi:MAG: recombinase family protein [Candidatus Liptonbacteria bacterium]|nr:recombinase family protein [Candidatus Liptonbacteria bacterium]